MVFVGVVQRMMRAAWTACVCALDAALNE